MPPSTAPAPPPNRPRARRLLQSVVVMLALSACCLFAGLIAGKHPLWIDATSTRAHRLGQRTRETLARLPGPTELIVTINSAAIDPRSAERTRDVLDTFSRASDNLSVTVVDVASADGPTRLDSVWSRIGARYATEFTIYQAAVSAAASREAELGLQLDRVSGLIAGAESSIPSTEKNADSLKRFLGDAASFCRLGSKDIAAALEKGREMLKSPIGRSPVPPFDAEITTLRRPLATIGPELTETSRSLETAGKATDDQVPAAIRDRLKPLAPEVAHLRELLAGVEAAFDAIPRLPLISVARVLERASAAMVIGPPPGPGTSPTPSGRGLAAVDIDALFPARTESTGDAPSTRIDMRAKTEEVLASAVASIVNPAPPILVLLHGEDRRFAPEFQRFAEVFERLRLRGIDIVEWPVWIDKELPSLAKLNPRADRPVVFATIYTIPDSPEDAARYINLAHAIEQLASAGKPILMSFNPSTMPGIGQADSIAEFLAPMGLKVDSGRPLLHQVGSPAAPAVTSETFVTVAPSDHPIARAITGERLRFPWAISLKPQPGATAAITPLITVDADGKTWGEAQWLDFRSVPASQRPFIRPQDQPQPDSKRDDTQGPWTVAAAIEKKPPLSAGASAPPQRLVVVGSNGWFLDEVAEAGQIADNRRIMTNPGNTDLLEASIYWLAGQDAAIGSAPQTQAAPVIPALKAGAVQAIRWALIAGLPLLILLIGAAWRLARG